MAKKKNTPLVVKKTSQEAIVELFGKGPDRRFQSRNILQRLAEKYPDLLQSIADHASLRLDEAGDDISAGRLQAIRLESETLAIRQALLDRVIRDGLIAEDGTPHPTMGLVMKLTDQALRNLSILGISPPRPAKPDTSPSTALHEVWARALQTTGKAEIKGSPARDDNGDTEADNATASGAGEAGL